MLTPGDRLKYIREQLLKLSRSDVYKKYGLSPDTLSAWEKGKIQITERGIERCIKIYNAENLLVSREWILTGEGIDPSFSLDLKKYFSTLTTEKDLTPINDTTLLAKEIDFFRSLTPNSITGLISSDDMLPIYARGDYVGGRLRYGKDIENCIDKDCIVKTKDGATYIRRLSKSPRGEKYNLACLNLNWNGSPEPIIFDVELEGAAPIIWHRRMDDYE